MKWINIVVTLGALVLIVALSMLDPPRRTAPAYNAANEIKLTGTIENVAEFFCPISDDQGLHLTMKTDLGSTLVHVAPARFLRQQDIRFEPGQKIDVVGARVKFEGKESILAREIARGSEVLLLRDHSGSPLWANK